MKEKGSVKYEKHEREKPVLNHDNQINVIAAVVEDPQISSTEISNLLSIGTTSVKKNLKKNRFHPYRLKLGHALTAQDYDARIHFCNWAITKIEEDNEFFEIVLFSDEATFHNNGHVNRHNLRYYADFNPNFVRPVDHQHRWSINVWGAVVAGRAIGPHFFDGHLNRATFQNFLNEELDELLEDVPLGVLNRMWFQLDGAPSHYSAGVRNVLHEKFPGRWIGRGGPVLWPPRSTDLTKLDFFLWGYVKDQVYKTPPTTREDMKERIIAAFRTITPEMLRNVNHSLTHRLNLCLRENGRQFEYLMN